MNITHTKQLSFKGLTKDSRKFIEDEIKELRHLGKDQEAHEASKAMKTLIAKAKNHTVIYNEDYIIIKNKNSRSKVKEMIRGFFYKTKLADFLRDASNYIEKEKLKKIKPYKKPTMTKKLVAKCVRFFSKLK